MNWLSKIWGKFNPKISEPAIHSPVEETASVGEQSDILKDLFVDQVPPQQQNDSEPNLDSILKQFLDKDYSPKGFNDGYRTYSAENLENNMRKIKAEFRYMIDMVIDKNNKEIYSLEIQFIATEGIDERTSKQLQRRIEELQKRIKELERQKELSVDDEGLVMFPIHNYREGFVRGIQIYHEQKFFASSTGLFN